jgi:predicted ester cyclase
MSEEQNKAIVRRFFEEVWNQQKDNVIDEIFASTIIFNGQSITRDARKQALAGRRNAFSDILVTVDDQVADGEKVSTRRTWRATHRGLYRGDRGGLGCR